jgi:antitoxin (DNA-binding transcriptional repressor) of toxin-antitoxin stability system
MVFNMQSISTRDLAHRASEVRRILSTGQPLQWASRGKVIARLEPPARPEARGRRDWIARAMEAGAVNRSRRTVGMAVYDDRG